MNPTLLVDALPQGAAAGSFALAVLVLNATPGVDLLLTTTRTLQRGARAGLATAVGVALGCAVHALAAAFGLAALLALHPGAFRVLQVAGAAYLLWMAWGLGREALRPAAGVGSATACVVGPHGASGDRGDGPLLGADFRAGLVTNLLNPKIALFFMAFLPAFVPAASPDRTVSMLLLGGWFVVQGLLFLAALVAMVARVGRHAHASRWRRPLQALGGLLFVAIAIRLLADAPVPAAATAGPR
jgi:threonine/homoserine/homoserine lactone efflux protein